MNTFNLFIYVSNSRSGCAGIAQSVEHFTSNEEVPCSNHGASCFLFTGVDSSHLPLIASTVEERCSPSLDIVSIHQSCSQFIFMVLAAFLFNRIGSSDAPLMASEMKKRRNPCWDVAHIHVSCGLLVLSLLGYCMYLPILRSIRRPSTRANYAGRPQLLFEKNHYGCRLERLLEKSSN